LTNRARVVTKPRFASLFMVDVLNLALPFFGLILLGFGSGRLFPLPERELGWLNFFIFYIALPPLFFQLISRTPFEQLANGRFVLATTTSTALTFALSFLLCFWLRGKASEATIAGTVGGYANIGYLGPGLTLAALGSQATVPTALIFTFDSIFLFSAVPFLMALSGVEKKSAAETALLVLRRVVTHPFIIATALGVLAAWAHVRPPVALDRMLEVLMNAAAPCALFTLGVTVALRPLKRVPPDVPALVAIKLIVHPLIAWTLLSLAGNFDPVWVYTAVLMASLPTALNAFVMAKQYNVYVQQASAGILVSTLASFVTVTTLMYLVQHKLLAPNLFH
jgi:malonate transporter and related proteins